MNNQELKDIIEDWYQLKKRVSELEKRIDINRDTVLAGELCVKKSILERESITRKDVPSEIWHKYANKSKSYMYKVGKRK